MVSIVNMNHEYSSTKLTLVTNWNNLFFFFFYLHNGKIDDMIERNSMNVTLHDVDPTALRQLIDYAYTGEITITEDNVQVYSNRFSIRPSVGIGSFFSTPLYH